MSEERTQYTAGGKVTPDNAGAAMQLITENYIAQLERTIDGYAMIQGRHAEMIAERDRRIAELTDALERKNGALHALDVEVQRQSETIARLEADNRRLRHLDAMPLDALRRYYRGTVYTPAAAQRYDYMPDDYDTDSAEIYHWLFPHEGDA